MPLQQLPVTGLDDINHRRRHREITNKILTHQFDDSKVQTLAERLAELTPVNYAYPAEPVMDARRYGLYAEGTAAANAAAITSAIAALGSGGGTVQLPAWTFNSNEIVVPEAVWIRGAGMYSTRITYAGNGTFASVGSAANTGVLKGPCGISDCALYLTHKDGEGIRLRETKGSIVARMYIEGTQTAARTNRLVVIDGGNISSFFNHIDDVICNHGESCFVILTSGSQRATCQYFTNCSAVGDVGSVGAASKGLSIISSGGGDGSVWIGGNFETCGTGVHCDATALGFTVVGARFELNTKDIVLTAGCKPAMFFGLNTDSSYNVTDVNAIGGFYGCQTTSGSRWTSQSSLTATLTTMTVATSGPILWRKEGVDVELQNAADIFGILNGTSLQLSGIPSGLIPGVNHIIPCVLLNQGNVRKGLGRVNNAAGTIDFYIDTISGAFVQPSLTGFATGSLTGLPAGWTLRYRLD